MITDGKFIMPSADVTITAEFVLKLDADTDIDDAKTIIDNANNATFFMEYKENDATVKKEVVITETAVVNSISRVIGSVKTEEIYSYFSEDDKYYECVEIKESAAEAATVADGNNISKREITKVAFDKAVTEIKEEYKVFIDTDIYEKNADGKYVVKESEKPLFAAKMGVDIADVDKINVTIENGAINFDTEKLANKTDLKLGVKNVSTTEEVVSEELKKAEVTPLTIDSFGAAIKGLGLKANYAFDGNYSLEIFFNENSLYGEVVYEDGKKDITAFFIKDGKYTGASSLIDENRILTFEVSKSFYDSTFVASVAMNKLLLSSRWWNYSNGIYTFNRDKFEQFDRESDAIFGADSNSESVRDWVIKIEDGKLHGTGLDSTGSQMVLEICDEPIIPDDIYNMNPIKLDDDRNPNKPNIPAPGAIKSETNGVNLDNLHEFIQDRSSNFTLDIEFIFSGILDGEYTEQVQRQTNKYNPDKIIVEYNNEFDYTWVDGKYMYYADVNSDGTISKTKRYSSDFPTQRIIELPFIAADISRFFEADGNKWRIIDDKIREYCEYVGYSDNDYERTDEIFGSIRIEFTDTAVILTAHYVETNGDGQYLSYTISDINATSVNIPTEYLDMEVTRDEVTPPAIPGVTDNFGDFIVNGSYELNQFIDNNASDNSVYVRKDNDKVEIRVNDNNQSDKTVYIWKSADKCYKAEINHSNNNEISRREYELSEYASLIREWIAPSFLINNNEEYLVNQYGQWVIDAERIDEYADAVKAENNGVKPYPRSFYENLVIEIYENDIRIYSKYVADGNYLSLQQDYRGFDAQTVEIPEDILYQTSTNGIGLNELKYYLESGDSRFTMTAKSYSASADAAELTLDSSVKYVYKPDCYSEVKDDGSAFKYVWTEGDYVYCVTPGSGEVKYAKTKDFVWEVDKYRHKVEIPFLAEASLEFYERDGDKWKVAAAKIDEYCALIGLEQSMIFGRDAIENLRFEFRDEVIVVTTRFEYKEAPGTVMGFEYIIGNIGLADFAMPGEAMDAAVSKDMTAPEPTPDNPTPDNPTPDSPASSTAGITLDGIEEYLLNGSYESTIDITGEEMFIKTIQKYGDKYSITTLNSNTGETSIQYYWQEGGQAYRAYYNEASEAIKTPITLDEYRDAVIPNVLFNGMSSYFVAGVNRWKLAPDKIDEYMAMLNVFNRPSYPREMFENLWISFSEIDISIYSEYDEAGVHKTFKFIIRTDIANDFMIPDEILNALPLTA